MTHVPLLDTPSEGTAGIGHLALGFGILLPKTTLCVLFFVNRFRAGRLIELICPFKPARFWVCPQFLNRIVPLPPHLTYLYVIIWGGQYGVGSGAAPAPYTAGAALITAGTCLQQQGSEITPIPAIKLLRYHNLLHLSCYTGGRRSPPSPDQPQTLPFYGVPTTCQGNKGPNVVPPTPGLPSLGCRRRVVIVLQYITIAE